MKSFEEIDSFPSQKILLLCEKCGKKSLVQNQNGAQFLKEKIKAEVKAKNVAQKLRPVLSSCLGVCPENKITAALMSTQGDASHFYLLDVDDPEVLFKEIIDQALK